MSNVNSRPTGGLLFPRPPVQEAVAGLPNGGTAGQVLTKNSSTDQDASWADPTGGSSSGGGGALVFLKEVTVAAGASADFTSVIGSQYDDYELVYEGLIPGTNGALIGVQLSADNGATWITTGYRGAVHSIGLSTNFSNYQQQTAQPFLNLAGAFGNTKTSNGKMELYAANTSSAKRAHTRGVYGGNDGNVYGSTNGSDYDTATTFNALRVIASSGTITGTFRLYGRAKSAAPASEPTWVVNHPDTPPASPTLFGGVLYDIEMVRDNTYPAGGTTIGAPAIAPSVVDRALRVASGTGMSADMKGVEFACPATAFTLTAKIRRRLVATTYGAAGIGLRRNTSGAGNLIAEWAATSSIHTATNYEIDKYTAPNARSSSTLSVNMGSSLLSTCYMRWVYDGTNIKAYVSLTGHEDTFVLHISEAATTFLGGAPGRWFVAIDNFGSGQNYVYLEWARFT